MASWDEKLLKAAELGNIKEVELCIKNRANLECKDDDFGETPLMKAAVGRHLEVVTYLVTHGSQLEATSTSWGQTPLMLAAMLGRLEVVTYLVTHGSQLDTTTKQGETALHIAAEYGRIDVTKWLINQGCSPWVKSKQGKTPYDLVPISTYCSKEKKKEVMDFLKTAMSKTSPEVTPDTHLQEPAAPVVEETPHPLCAVDISKMTRVSMFFSSEEIPNAYSSVRTSQMVNAVAAVVAPQPPPPPDPPNPNF